MAILLYDKKTPVPCCHGTGAESFCGTTQIGASRPLCTHSYALRRGNGRGCRRTLLVAFRAALVRPFTLSSPAAIPPPAALLALPSGLLLLRIGLRCLIICNVPPSPPFVNGLCTIQRRRNFLAMILPSTSMVCRLLGSRAVAISWPSTRAVRRYGISVTPSRFP